MRTVLLAALFFIIPVFSHAQITSVVDTGLALELSPNYPSPGATFGVSVNDYGGGAFGATIDWFYNDSKLDWAYNQRTITLSAPNAGETSKLVAVLTKPNGAIERIVRDVSPYHLDIIIEPQTHVPNFFRGRALPSAGSTINATALLSSKTFLTGDYLYTWRLNDTVLEGGPLRGGNRVAFTMPQDTYSTLSLTVTKLDGSTLAKRTIAVPVVAPRLLFYEVNTLYGILEQALRSPYTLVGNSMTLRAEPYYLDSSVFNYPSITAWQLNGTAVESGSNPYDITLERTDTAGSVTATFRVQSTTKLLQGAKGEFNINVI